MSTTPHPPLVLSWRIGRPLFFSDAAFAPLLDFVQRHRGVVDEIAFFETISHHLYLPLDFFREMADVMARRFEALKRTGIRSTGVNILTTLGHVNEAWDFLPPLPFRPMVGHDGDVSKCSACPTSPEFKQYVHEKYAIFARIHPDFIWVDDDIRMHHHGIAWGCFCEKCVEDFAQSTSAADRLNTPTFRAAADKRDAAAMRVALVEALNAPAPASASGAATIRSHWVQTNANRITTLLRDIATTIHTIDPKTQTGLMTAGPGWTTYSGMAFREWFTALEATKARPGGGFYSDDTPIDMVGKALEMGRQCELLPDSVPERQYELENFPYATLSKAAATVVNECTLALAAGCTGVAFNALGFTGQDTLATKEPLLQSIEAARPFWEGLHRHMAGAPSAGFWAAWHPRLAGMRAVKPGEDWFGWSPFYSLDRPLPLARFGMPISAQKTGDGVILAGRIAEAFSTDELRTMLAGPVILDAFALEILQDRGLAELTGVRIERWYDNGVAEVLTADPINHPHAGALRDIRNEFWGDPLMKTAQLQPTAPTARILATLETYMGQSLGPCMSAFENPLGGRVIVLGFAPWRFTAFHTKRMQILNAADWATRGRSPVRIREAVSLLPMVRLTPDRRRGAVLLLNAGLDPIAQAQIELRVPEAPLHLAAPDVAAAAHHAIRKDESSIVMLKNIAPWSTRAILLG